MVVQKRFSNDGTEEMSLSAGDDDHHHGVGVGVGRKVADEEEGMVVFDDVGDSSDDESYDTGGGSSSSFHSDITGSKSGSFTSRGSSSSKSTVNLRWLWNVLRYLVFGILAVTAILVGLQSVRDTRWKIEKDFQNEFDIVARSVLKESSVRCGQVLESFQDIGVMTTTLVQQQQAASSIQDDEAGESPSSSSWPFVTLSNFQEWAGTSSYLPSNITLTVLIESHLRDRWADYSKRTASTWISEAGMAMLTDSDGDGDDDSSSLLRPARTPTSSSSPSLTTISNNITHDVWTWYNGSKVVDPMGIAAVNWQSTAPDTTVVNYNTLRNPIFSKAFVEIRDDDHGYNPFMAHLDGNSGSSIIFQPVFQQVNPTNIRRDFVGFFYSSVSWVRYFEHILQDNIQGIHVVVEDTCGGGSSSMTTLLLRGSHAIVLGSGDLHHTEFDDFMIENDIGDDLSSQMMMHGGHSTATLQGCKYKLRVYPSKEYRQAFLSKNEQALSSFPISIALCIILFFAVFFLVYDWFVRRKQRKIIKSAKQSLAIVNSLFPANVRDRIMNNDDTACNFSISPPGDNGNNNNRSLKKNGDDKVGGGKGGTNVVVRRTISKPIADLFPETTILFADIVGFTAWSSQREPPCVFTLLENIYDTFDQIAKKRNVFKVETIGDCYVAVCGLPTPNPNHAVAMSSFARRALDKMLRVVSELEILLGPGTSDLGMRFGLHSGPVMGGVLRGDKSRFQLFGDTMNTAARMESTGAKNKIHLSSETAELISQAGKESWLLRRNDLVSCKGKGELQTFWLDLTASKSRPELTRYTSTRSLLSRNMSVASFGQGFETRAKPLPVTRKDSVERLIDYNVQVLASLLKKVVAMDPSRLQNMGQEVNMVEPSSSMVLEEVAEVIVLPSKPAKYAMDPEQVELPPSVYDQLRQYVSWVASLYHDVPFHGFEHASHVLMSVVKLLSRIVTPDSVDYDTMEYKTKAQSSKLHEYTFGITSSPLTQFAVAFSALIHDLDHEGVPNAQLIKEGTYLATKYRNKSVAEQNSVDLAWNKLLSSDYKDLRACIYGSQEELNRFRQLVVNVVMATDIVDKELGSLRKKRWESVFNPSLDGFISEQDSSHGRAPIVIGKSTTIPEDDVNRKATIVIEHLIQASDVSHTMQHWHVYLKWNQKFFNECYKAYKEGRAEKDPSLGWYDSEIGFFDFYIIPLAKKLSQCGVFGVSSEEYLQYAEANRKEWAAKGNEIVQEYLAEFEANSSPTAMDSRELSKHFKRPSSFCSFSSESSFG